MTENRYKLKFYSPIKYFNLFIEKMKNIVNRKLIPKWLADCNNNVVTLFVKLDLSTKPITSQLILDAIYP
jgi:hypothetical protein